VLLLVLFSLLQIKRLAVIEIADFNMHSGIDEPTKRSNMPSLMSCFPDEEKQMITEDI